MKVFVLSIAIIGMMLALASCSSVKATPEAIAGVTKQVNEKDYTIDVRTANPLRGRAIQLSYGYELKVKADSAFVYLPYYGVAQRAQYGGTDGGIKFEEPMKDYTVTPKKNNSGWDISFKADTRDSRYEFSLSIFNNGNASFTVNSTDRDAISYNGEVKKQ